MNWYILTETVNAKIRGKVYVQASGLFSPEIPYRDDFAKYIYEPIPDDLKVPPFKLEYRAKLTDLLLKTTLISSRLISTHFKRCLDPFHAPPYKLFPTYVIDRKGVEHPYFILMQNGRFDIVDYSRSIFSRIKEIKNGYEYVYEDFKAESFEDYRNQKGIGSRELYIKEGIQWDFFLLGGPPFPWMVNEKIADALREAGITGICLVPFQQGDDFVHDSLAQKIIRTCGV